MAKQIIQLLQQILGTLQTCQGLLLEIRDELKPPPPEVTGIVVNPGKPTTH